MTQPLTIQVVSAEDAEKVSYVVCCRQGMSSPFTDNETGNCCACGHAIFFRPTSPKKPPKLCMECAADMAGALQ